jgi:enoyl-CoA hydratase
MSENPVSFELSRDVAVVRMDDGKANALSPAMLDGLDEAFGRATKEAKATVLVGREGRFSAGFDLRHMMAGPAEARALLTQGADVLMKAYGHPQPLVVACTGHALAGGALLVLTGDVRIGTLGEFKIGLNEVAIGMPLPILALEMARDRLAPKKLTEATLTARQYAPPEAVQVGYLDEALEADAVLPAAMERAKQLTQLSGTPFAASKRGLRGGTIQHIRDTLDANLREFGA